MNAALRSNRTAALVQLPYLQPGRAFELTLGELRWQLRIGAALAWLAVEADAQDDLTSVSRVIHLAALLDEQRADCAFAFSGRRTRAIARGHAIETRRHDAAEDIGIGALAQIGLRDVVAVLGPRVGHHADAAQHAGRVEQCRDHDREGDLGRSRPARDLALRVAGARDVFKLVVVFEIDLVQTIGLGAAAREITPAGERLARGAAIRPAGEAAELAR